MVTSLYGQHITKHAHLTHRHIPGPDAEPSPLKAQLYYYRCRDCGGHGKHFEKRSVSRSGNAAAPPGV